MIAVVVASLSMVAAGAVAAPAATAADVDLAVNVSSDRAIYAVDQSAVYTVRIDNRSDQQTAAGATVALDVPNMLNSGLAWETSASAVSGGGGAAAPQNFVRSADGRTVTATLPALPAGGWISFALTAPGNPANGVTGALTVTATVTPAAGDTDVHVATDSATAGVVIKALPADYATSITGYPTAGVADGATITADVSIVNTGVRNNLRSTLSLAGELGTGTKLVSAVLLSGPAAAPTLTSDTAGRIDVGNLPAGTTSVVRFTIAVGAACNVAGTPRTLTLTSAVAPSGGVAEAVALNGDNTASATFSVLTPACRASDVRTDSLTQVTPASGALPHDGPFAFEAAYSNTGPDAAPSTIRFTLGWATGEGGPSMDADPVCVAAGGAVCPTSWEITPTVTPGTPGIPTSRGQSAVTAVGSGAVVPTGGTLTITYSGTGGAADDLICGDPAGSVLTSVTAAPSFTDADATNNFMNLAPGEQIGIACGISHDLRLTVPWYRNDPAGTPLPQTTVDFEPGDTAYFDITALNASNPDQGGLGEAGTAPMWTSTGTPSSATSASTRIRTSSPAISSSTSPTRATCSGSRIPGPCSSTRILSTTSSATTR
ncbi:hypothetical protein [Homoserinibacter gongjuensis]|uniref:hypothetical protein n=1 Tax=Homoserinibacter gongjuensis TaxID=1162968 RepID=UPI0024E122BD|nr:hypothetical protein [Homoserinibacter gongjuensis]